MNAQGRSAKSLVCEACWNGIFSFDAWQTVIAATQQPDRRQAGYSKGYCYTASWGAIHASAGSGCNWCQLLVLVGADQRRPARNYLNTSTATWRDDELVEIWVAYDQDSESTPAGTKMLMLKTEGTSGASGSSLQHYYMYTDAGM